MRWRVFLLMMLAPSVGHADEPTRERGVVSEVSPGNLQAVRSVRYVAGRGDGPVSRGTVLVEPSPGASGQRFDVTCDAGPQICLSSLQLVDVDFDGYSDLVILREHGAKWARYDVWVFEPRSRRFVRSQVAAELSRLVNLTIDASRQRILSFTVGPAMPSRSSYEVRANHIAMVEQCVFENVGTEPDGSLVIRRELGGVMQTVARRPLRWSGGPDPMPCVTVAP